jgi:hypothetical protein
MYAVVAIVEALYALRELLRGNNTACVHFIILMNQFIILYQLAVEKEERQAVSNLISGIMAWSEHSRDGDDN